MLNKPKFMRPSTNTPECVIDINESKLNFSCIVDGNEAVYAWRIKIYQLNNNEKVYDTGKITFKQNYSPTLPFFPINEKNQNVVFSLNLKDYPSIITSQSATFKNFQEPYYWSIEFWNGADNTTDTSGDNPTVVSCEEVFYANTTPEISMYYKRNDESDYTLFPTDGYTVPIFDANKYSFKAKYTQAENVPLKRYGWKLTDIDTGQVLIDTIAQNQIYGTADNIICSYDGLLNNSNYSVELYVETQNNAVVNTLPVSFTVSYVTTYLSSDFVTETLKNEPAVRNSWGDAKTIEGRRSDGRDDYISDYPIMGGGTTAVKIPQGEYITYDYGSTSNLDITEDSYIVLSTQLLNGEDTVLFVAEGLDDNGNELIRKLSFENGRFTYMVGNSRDGYETRQYTPSKGYKPSRYVWYIITMSPYSHTDRSTTLKVVESHVINSLYPSSNLYPSTSLYPKFGTWDKLKETEVTTN